MKGIQLFVFLLLSLFCCSTLSAQTNCSVSDFRILDIGPVHLPCSKLNISLTGQVRSNIVSYEWTTEDGYILSGADNLFPVIGSGGTYYLNVVGADGCVGVDSILVTTDAIKANLTIVNTSTAFNCNVSLIQLSAISSAMITSYQWITSDGQFISTSNSQTVAIDRPGTYQVIVTTPEGCASVSGITIGTELPPQVIIDETNTTIGCGVSQLQLDATASIGGATYEWTTGDGTILMGANTATPIVSRAGTYNLTVRSSNDCASSGKITISETNDVPILQLNQGLHLLTCATPQIELDASLSSNIASYQWIAITGNIVSNPTAPRITIDQPGIYQIIVTSPSGCTAQDEVVVGINEVVPTAVITTAPTLTCERSFIELNAIASTNASSFLWTTTDGSILVGEDTPLPMVTQAGTYTLVVTSANGCTDTANVIVSQDNNVPQINILSPPTLD